MAITLVQSTTADSTGTQVSSINVGPLTITAGNSIIVHVCIRSGAPVAFTVNDNVNSGNYANDKTNIGGSAPSCLSRHHNSAGGATTVTVAPGASCAMEVIMQEWAGLDPAGTVDQTGVNSAPANNTNLSVNTSGSVAQTAEVAIANFTTPFSNASYSQSGSYLIDSNHTPRCVAVYLTPVPTGVQTGTVTIPSSQAWSGLIATYKAAPTAPAADSSGLVWPFMGGKLAGPFSPTQFSNFPYSTFIPPPPQPPGPGVVAYVPLPGPGKGPLIQTMFPSAILTNSTSPPGSAGGAGGTGRRRLTSYSRPN